MIIVSNRDCSSHCGTLYLRLGFFKLKPYARLHFDHHRLRNCGTFGFIPLFMASTQYSDTSCFAFVTSKDWVNLASILGLSSATAVRPATAFQSTEHLMWAHHSYREVSNHAA